MLWCESVITIGLGNSDVTDSLRPGVIVTAAGRTEKRRSCTQPHVETQCIHITHIESLTLSMTASFVNEKARKYRNNVSCQKRHKKSATRALAHARAAPLSQSGSSVLATRG